MYIGLHVKRSLFLSGLNEFSRQIFGKYSNIRLYENPSSGSTVVPCGRTDGHDDANSHFSQFCKRAYKLFLGININIRCLLRCAI